MLISRVYLATDVYHLILTNFVFKTVDTPQQFSQAGVYFIYAGIGVTAAKVVWEGVKWIGNKFYKWMKGKDKELQKELNLARASQSQTPVGMNDQLQARRPLIQRSMTTR